MIERSISRHAADDPAGEGTPPKKKTAFAARARTWA